MDWMTLVKIIGPISIGIVGILAYFLRKPASVLEEAQADKIKREAEILKNDIREESIDLLKNMLATQTDLINLLRTEVQELRKEITDLRGDYEKLWDDNNKLRDEIKTLKGGNL